MRQKNSEFKNFIPDRWLESILHREAYKIVMDSVLIGKLLDERSDEYLFWQGLLGKPVFLYAKISTASLPEVKFLLERGFYLADTNILFSKDASLAAKVGGSCLIRFALPEDANQVAELAGKAFTYSRFHRDSFFSAEIANTIKAQWARGYFSGSRGEAMIVALADKSIVGFLQLLDDGQGKLTIDLIAVDSNYQKRGIAADMISYAQGHCRNVREIYAGTQVINIAAMRLYQRLGFKIIDSSYVLHYHKN